MIENRYQSVLAKLEAKLTTAKALLLEVEWVFDSGIGEYMCPVCDKFQNEGHTAHCRLAALLRNLE